MARSDAFFTTALLVAAIAACAGRSKGVAESPCLTNGASATTAVDLFRTQMNATDSAGAVNSGFPYKPANVAIVNDSATCARIIASFNAGLRSVDSLWRVTAAYIAKAWPPTAYLLYVPSTDTTLDSYHYFDSAFVAKGHAVGLK